MTEHSNVVRLRPEAPPPPKRRVVVTASPIPGEFLVGMETEAKPYVLFGTTHCFSAAIDLAQDRSAAMGGLPIWDFSRSDDRPEGVN